MRSSLIRSFFSSSANRYPILDFSIFQQPQANLNHLQEQLNEALSTDGFFYIKNHGISLEEYKNFIQTQKDFFSLKNKDTLQKNSNSKGYLRGYIPMGLESGNKDLFELKEGYSYGYEQDIAIRNSLEQENIWPKEQKFQQNLTSIYNQFSLISQQITVGLSGVLNQNLSQLCENGEKISLMRMFHYLPKTQGNNHIGSSPHTDWGFLTLIMQSHQSSELQGGLQVFKNNQWLDVPSIENHIIVNGGDYLTLLSNGKFQSPLHRVVNGPEERFSYVYFYYPGYDAALPNTRSQQDLSLLKNQEIEQQQNEAFYKDKTFGEVITKKWDEVSKQY